MSSSRSLSRSRSRSRSQARRRLISDSAVRLQGNNLSILQSLFPRNANNSSSSSERRNYETIAHNVRLRGMSNDQLYRPAYNGNPTDYGLYLRSAANAAQDILERILNQFRQTFAVKAMLSLKAIMVRRVEGEEEEKREVYFNSQTMSILDAENIGVNVEIAVERIRKRIEDYVSMGSNYTFLRGEYMILSYSFYQLQRMSGTWMKTPEKLARKTCTINPISNDNKCFLWCILIHLFSDRFNNNQNRASKYKQFIDPSDPRYDPSVDPHLVWSDASHEIQFPFDLTMLTKFEKWNKDFAFNIFTFEDCPQPHLAEKWDYIGRKRIYCGEERLHTINLCLLVGENKINHFIYINDFSRFMSKSKYGKMFYCYHDLLGFRTEERLKEHKKICRGVNENVCLEFPKKKESVVKFENYYKKLPTPFFIVADLESINFKVKKIVRCNICNSKNYLTNNTLECTKCKQSLDDAKEEKKSELASEFTHEQRACSCALYVVNTMNYNENSKIEIIRASSDEDILNEGENGFGSRVMLKIMELTNDLITRVKEEKKPLRMCAEDEIAYDNATACHICLQPFTDSVNYKVKDHCHLTGQFRGAAHRICNLSFTYTKPGQNVDNKEDKEEEEEDIDLEGDLMEDEAGEVKERVRTRKLRWKVPIFFHNMKGYDGHFLIQWFSAKFKKLFIIPQNREKFTMISTNTFKFLDSMNFFAKSLEKLVDSLMGRDESLNGKLKQMQEFIKHDGSIRNEIIQLKKQQNEIETKGRSAFTFLLQEFARDFSLPVVDTNKESSLNLLLEKGNWPYEYFTSISQFNETKLPPPEAYASKIAMTDRISEEEYSKELEKWSLFNMKNLWDAHDLYLKLDVVLLADILENMRKILLEYYKLDFTWYLSLPAYSWDALMFQGFTDSNTVHSNINIDIFYDEPNQRDMYLWIEKSIRGGMSMIPHRYAQANNKYIPGYDETKPSSYLWYVDANQLYSWAMKQRLPYCDFRWIPQEDFVNISIEMMYDRILALQDETDDGFVFEVDLEYPQQLHETHSDYPLAPFPRAIQREELSYKALEILTANDLTHSSKLPKLCSTLEPRNNYVVHYRNLKLYLQLGMRLKKVHRILSFTQKPWIASYVQKNVQFRSQATSDFQKDLFKLMNNATFGKTMEDQRKQIDFQLVFNDGGMNRHYQRLVSSPYYQCDVPIAHNEDLVGVSIEKKKAVLNKPITTGFAILDLSKLLMYNFYYNGLQAQYSLPKQLKLCMTDTDSLCVLIETNDLYEDMLQNNNKVTPFIDFSNYASPIKKNGWSIVPYSYLTHYQYIMGGVLYVDENKENVLIDSTNTYPLLMKTPPSQLLTGMNPHAKKVDGFFKDEWAGYVITEFCGLKPKCYAIKDEMSVHTKKAKGVPKLALKKLISMQDYKNCIFSTNKTNRIKKVQFTKLTAQNHAMYVQKRVMLALTAFDTKRWICDDNISTYAYGHYVISALNEESKQKREDLLKKQHMHQSDEELEIDALDI
jgi:hypothetical protein